MGYGRVPVKKKPAKKPKPRRRSKDPFTELVKAINEKTQLPESSGRGQVKGSDVASMKDILEQEGKDVWRLLYPISQENIKKLYTIN